MSPEFTEESKEKVREIISHYPRKEAALLPVLHAAQAEFGHISPETEKMVAQLLDLSPVRVREVVSFYTMYNRKPVGKYHIQICSNLTCSILGGESLLDFLESTLKIKAGQTTEDGLITLSTVECLGACEEGPCMMVNFDYHGRLSKAKLDQILKDLK